MIDITGIWRDEESLSQHLNCGASKVILTAPAKGDIRNIVFGVNDSVLPSDQIISLHRVNQCYSPSPLN